MATEGKDAPHPIETEAEAEDMEVEATSDAVATDFGAGSQSNAGEKREREEGREAAAMEEISKKPKEDTSVEEERFEKLKGKTEGVAEMKEDENGEETGSVSLGPKQFGSSLEMFNYFFKILHSWSTDLDINKYEHMVLLDLIKKGHAEKIGEGIQAFQVRIHPTWKSRCFFFVRADGSSDDFSYRKCVNRIRPLPENMRLEVAGRSIEDGRGRDGSGRGGRERERGRGHGRRGGR